MEWFFEVLKVIKGLVFVFMYYLFLFGGVFFMDSKYSLCNMEVV